MGPGAQSVRRAVRLPDDGAELLGFCARHADGGLDAATRERLLTVLHESGVYSRSLDPG